MVKLFEKKINDIVGKLLKRDRIELQECSIEEISEKDLKFVFGGAEISSGGGAVF